LSKLTIVAAIIFMLSALFISMPAFSGNISVLSGSGDAPVEETVEQGTTNANTNVATENANGALIETPATDAAAADANAAAAQSSNANVNAAPANK
jgi:hypothetical protein